MALVVITIQDEANGQASFNVTAEPALPRTMLDGAPSKAQAAAAVMLNAISAKLTGEDPTSKIITLN